MRLLNQSSLLCLSLLVGCSNFKSDHKVNHSHPHRHVASMDELLNDQGKLKLKVEKLTEGIFHGYLLGQVHLNDFDAQLDKDPASAMKSSSYSTLLAIRTHVDEFEHQINDLYLNLVMASSLPEYTPIQKLNAELTLRSIGKFVEGVKTDKSLLPENLRPLILSNLSEKQAELVEVLKEIQSENTDENVKKSLDKNIALLRATKMSFQKELNDYKVDKKLLAKTIQEEKKKESFQKLEEEIKELSLEMKSFISEVGRDTSSNEIRPSAGSAGNISGKTFPKGTWSLTYDDGPGKTTTTQVLQNLVDRNLPATFFMLAKQVEAYPSVGMKIKNAGMDIASHSYTHAQLTKVGTVQLEREIGTSKKVIESKLGTDIKLFRLPYGAGVSVSKVRAKIAEHNMVHVFWTVDTLDWQDKNPQSILKRTLKQMNASANNSGIILFHDIHKQSVIASTLLMDHMKKQKLSVCTVQGVVDQINNGTSSCK